MPKLYWISNLRVFATIMVILIHTSGGALFHFKDMPQSWWVANLVAGFGRFTVPVFVMISGALLLGKEIEVLNFIQKRFLRVWVPFTLWVIIYVLYHNYFEIKPYAFQTALTQYFTGGNYLYGHLWFVYMILGLYLVTPLLNKWLLKANEVQINILLGCCFTMSCVIHLIKRPLGIHIPNDLQNFGGYIGYFVAGYVLKNKQLTINKFWFLFVFIVGYSLLVFGSYFLVKTTGKLDMFFYDYFSPSVFLMSISIFMFFKKTFNYEFLPKIINPLDKFSFGIYLCHLQIITILSRKLTLNWAWHPPVLGIFAHAALTLTIAFILIWALSKFPQSQWLIG
jgi:surface polysaccharide O-acyltransferase-like enzyme